MLTLLAHVRFVWVTIGVLALGITLLLSTGQDDAYLTFLPAYTLASFGEIVN